MLTRSHKDIALMVEVDLEDVSNFITATVEDKGIITWQMKLDQRRGAGKSSEAIKNPIEKPVPVDNIVAEAKKLSFEKREQKRANLAERMNVERQRVNNRRQPQYKTKVVDYSKMVTIRIDRTTTIYAHPGEEEKTKKNFLKFYKRPIDRFEHTSKD